MQRIVQWIKSLDEIKILLYGLAAVVAICGAPAIGLLVSREVSVTTLSWGGSISIWWLLGTLLAIVLSVVATLALFSLNISHKSRDLRADNARLRAAIDQTRAAAKTT